MPFAVSFGYEVPEEYIFGEHITDKDRIRTGNSTSMKRHPFGCLLLLKISFD